MLANASQQLLNFDKCSCLGCPGKLGLLVGWVMTHFSCFFLGGFNRLTISMDAKGSKGTIPNWILFVEF